MSLRTSKLTTMLAGLALASLPALVGAQATSPQHPKPAPRSEPHPTTRHTADADSAQHHLDEAGRVLHGIDASTLKGQTATQVSDVRRHFHQLESAWRARKPAPPADASIPSGHSTGHVTGTTGTAPAASDWMTHYTAIDQILDRVLGANASASGRATAGTTGVTADVKTSADMKIDASTRTKLTEFRKHLDAFHHAAMAGMPAHGSAGLGIPEPHAAIAPGATARDATPGAGATPQVSGATRPPGPMVSPHPPRSSATIVAGAQNTAAQAVGTTGVAPMKPSAAANSEALARLSAAIDDMLRASASSTVSRSAATTGSVCVERAQLEQIRREIEAMRTGGRP
jgi:hypothetical protein